MKTPDEHIKEIYDLVGLNFPIEIAYAGTQITGITYEKEWKEGTSDPVLNKDGLVVDYKQNYKDKKLSAKQIKQIEDWKEKIIPKE